jgi:hypothetical protein
MPPIEWDDLREGVAAFNNNIRDVAADTALHQATQGGFASETIELYVFAVNWFWRINIDQEPGALQFYCQLLHDELLNFA